MEPFSILVSFRPIGGDRADGRTDRAETNRLEAFMMTRLVTAAILGVASASTLLATGCASEGQKQPYSLTGGQSLTVDQQRWVDRHSIDDKGHFNPVLNQRAMSQMRLANQGDHQ